MTQQLIDREAVLRFIQDDAYAISFQTTGQYRSALTQAIAALPAEPNPAALHPRTADLVRRFSRALAVKLAAAEAKYGYSDTWATNDWERECIAKLHEHAAKGDPRDVAAYCAFAWHHGWSTALPVETAQATSAELLNFLYGSGPLDGVWFGESHPTERGAFWWRKYLPLLRAPQQQAESWPLDFNGYLIERAVGWTLPEYVAPPPVSEEREALARDMEAYAAQINRHLGGWSVAGESAAVLAGLLDRAARLLRAPQQQAESWPLDFNGYLIERAVGWTLPECVAPPPDNEAVQQILKPAYDALDKISESPNDMKVRRDAEIACFYLVQRLRAYLAR